VIRVALLLLLTVLGCTKRVETPRAKTPAPHVKTVSTPSAPIRTDRSSYALTNGPKGPEATIVATLRAPADRTLYIMNCNGATGITLQRKVGEAWEWAWLITMSACVSPPIVVPSGGEHTAQIRLHEEPGAVMPRRRIESGTYRVVWTGVLTSFDANAQGWGPELPLEERVSAPFTITR